MTRHGSTVLVEDQEYPLISIGGVMTTLDEAWAEAEAALPKGDGWKLRLIGHRQADDPANRYEARADRDVFFDGPGDPRPSRAWAANPTAALQNLRSLLENPGGTE